MPAIKVPQMPRRMSTTTDASSGVNRETSRAATKTPSVERSAQKKRSSVTGADTGSSKKKRLSKSSRSKAERKADKNGEATEADAVASTSAGSDEPVYQVEQINGKKKIKGKMNYLVKWLNWPKSQSTWEPYENVAHCHELIEEYEEFLNNTKGKRTSTSRSTAKKRSETRESMASSGGLAKDEVAHSTEDAEKTSPQDANVEINESMPEPPASATPAKFEVVQISEDESDHSSIKSKTRIFESPKNAEPASHSEINQKQAATNHTESDSVDEEAPAAADEESMATDTVELELLSDSEITKDPSSSVDTPPVETADKETDINFPDAHLSESLAVPNIDYDKTTDANLLLDLRRLAVKVQKLVGMSRKPGDSDLQVLIHFDGSPSFCRSYPLRVVRRAMPERLIEFYESSARILTEF